MTLYEKIKSMTVEEMSKFLFDCYCSGWVDGSNDSDDHENDFDIEILLEEVENDG